MATVRLYRNHPDEHDYFTVVISHPAQANGAENGGREGREKDKQTLSQTKTNKSFGSRKKLQFIDERMTLKWRMGLQKTEYSTEHSTEHSTGSTPQYLLNIFPSMQFPTQSPTQSFPTHLSSSQLPPA